jgi:type I restriction enzyme M protein
MVDRSSSRRRASIVQDPAAGTAGFLIAADRYIKAPRLDLFDLAEARQRASSAREAFYGVELVPDTHGASRS